MCKVRMNINISFDHWSQRCGFLYPACLRSIRYAPKKILLVTTIQVIAWKANQVLTLSDLARIKLVSLQWRPLFALCCLGRHALQTVSTSTQSCTKVCDFLGYLAQQVHRQICCFDCTARTYTGPRYKGTFLRRMFNRDLHVFTNLNDATDLQ